MFDHLFTSISETFYFQNQYKNRRISTILGIGYEIVSYYFCVKNDLTNNPVELLIYTF